MAGAEVPEFAINTPVAEPAPEREGLERAVLGLREKLEYYFRQSAKLEQRIAEDRERIASRLKQLFVDLIEVVDSFEDVFRMCEEDKALEPAAPVVESFRVTYDTLLRTLQKWGIHQVPVVGKGYDEVAFEGIPIAEPWEVVDVKSKKGRREGEGVARKALRSLWVREGRGSLEVLRRAQVVC
ncbi:MAG: nucleotide exchange factor GrpE [Planctomycetota bacterium]|jgi:molecular chaperone GrpE (heat shock protein)